MGTSIAVVFVVTNSVDIKIVAFVVADGVRIKIFAFVVANGVRIEIVVSVVTNGGDGNRTAFAVRIGVG